MTELWQQGTEEPDPGAVPARKRRGRRAENGEAPADFTGKLVRNSAKAKHLAQLIALNAQIDALTDQNRELDAALRQMEARQVELQVQNAMLTGAQNAASEHMRLIDRLLPRGNG